MARATDADDGAHPERPTARALGGPCGRRRTASLALALALALAAPRHPRAADAPPNALTIEPLTLILTRSVSLEYERALTAGVSVHLGPAFTVGGVTGSDDDTSYFGVGGQLGVRVFPLGTAPQGFFVGAFGQLAYAEAERGDEARDGVGWSAGGLLGYTWILADTFIFSVGAGAAYHRMTVSLPSGDVGARGVTPTGRASIGVAF